MLSSGDIRLEDEYQVKLGILDNKIIVKYENGKEIHKIERRWKQVTKTMLARLCSTSEEFKVETFGNILSAKPIQSLEKLKINNHHHGEFDNNSNNHNIWKTHAKRNYCIPSPKYLSFPVRSRVTGHNPVLLHDSWGKSIKGEDVVFTAR